jgi:hypothetical protein
MAACSRLTPPVAALCRVEIAKSGCPIIVPVGDGTPNDVLRWAQAVAGLTEAEIRRHPEHGHLIGVSGVRKLAARAPDTAAKMEFMAWLANEFPPGLSR